MSYKLVSSCLRYQSTNVNLDVGEEILLLFPFLAGRLKDEFLDIFLMKEVVNLFKISINLNKHKNRVLFRTALGSFGDCVMAIIYNCLNKQSVNLVLKFVDDIMIKCCVLLTDVKIVSDIELSSSLIGFFCDLALVLENHFIKYITKLDVVEKCIAIGCTYKKIEDELYENDVILLQCGCLELLRASITVLHDLNRSNLQSFQQSIEFLANPLN